MGRPFPMPGDSHHSRAMGSVRGPHGPPGPAWWDPCPGPWWGHGGSWWSWATESCSPPLCHPAFALQPFLVLLAPPVPLDADPVLPPEPVVGGAGCGCDLVQGLL